MSAVWQRIQRWIAGTVSRNGLYLEVSLENPQIKDKSLYKTSFQVGMDL